MSEMGQSLPKWAIRATSAFPPIATIERTSRHVSNLPNSDISHAHSSTSSAPGEQNRRQAEHSGSRELWSCKRNDCLAGPLSIFIVFEE
jgi:hypothetical protein